MNKNIILSLVISTLLFGCSSFSLVKKEEEKQYNSAEELYIDAINELKHKEISKASDLFEQLEKEFPYSKWSIKGQLMYSYLQYEQNNYDAAVASLERFLQLYPLHKNADYAYYLISLSQYEQINNAGRDQENTISAKNALEEVINRFPNSPYAKDARVKLDLVDDHLAAHEMSVGRFYLKKNNIVAALNRFQIVVENYQRTMQVSEALYRLAEIYYSMGMEEEAKKYASILGHNFPHNPWYHLAYNLLNKPEKKGKWYNIN